MADDEKILEDEETLEEEQAAEETAEAEAPAPEIDAAVPEADDVPAEPEASFELDLAEDEEEFDSLTFSNGVIEKIVALAVRDVPGVLGMKGGFVNRIQDAFGASAVTKGVTIDSTDDGSLIVNVSVFVEYGAYAPKVFEDIKSSIVNAMDTMTGLTVVGVNLNIADVLTPDEAARRKRTAAQQPRLEAPEVPSIEAPQEPDVLADLDAEDPEIEDVETAEE